MQSFGIKNINTGKHYLIQYDILNQKFISSINKGYTDNEKQFINEHINRFNLNDSRYRIKEFIYLIEDIIENNNIHKRNRYCNLVVELFLDKIQSFPKEKALKIWSFTYEIMNRITNELGL